MDKESPKVQISSNKIIQSCAYNVQHGDCSYKYCITYLKAEHISKKFSLHGDAEGQRTHENMLHITESSGKRTSKPNWDTTSHLSKWIASKSLQITNVAEDVEKREPLYTVGRNVNWCSTVENNIKVSQKSKTRTTIGPSNSTSAYTSKSH